MFSNFSFKDLDFENLNEQNSQVADGKSLGFPLYDGKQIVEPTAEGDLLGFEDFVMSRNIPVDVRNYEISFESTFMEEHELALKKQTENFIESSFKNQEQKEVTFASEQIFNKQLKFSTFAAEEENLMKTAEIGDFLKDIQKLDKLNSFFELLFKTYPVEFANEFIGLSSVAYNKHTETKNDEEFEADLIKKAKEFAESEYEKLFSDERIKFLNLSTVPESELKSKSEVKSAFKSYVEFFFTTVILIAEEYFSNPYTEANGKRERSYRLEEESEENEHSSTHSFGTPCKKTH